MRCVSCEADINAKWRHAINSNNCPFCGALIMEEHLKNLLSALGEIMDKLEEHPEYLEDWLKTNYKFVKEGSIQAMAPTKKSESNSEEFMAKVRTEDGIIDVPTKKLSNAAKTNDFFKRADAKNPAQKTQHIKEMVNKIRTQGSSGIMSNSNSEELSSANITPEMLGRANADEVEQMEKIIMAEQGIPMGMQADIDDVDDLDHLPPSPFLNMPAQGQYADPSEYNAKDAMRLQNSLNKTASARNKMLNGSAGKGGFSRS